MTVGEGIDQTGVGLAVGMDAVGREAELQRGAQVGVPCQLGFGNELTGGRDKLPILRVTLLDDRETGSSQGEDEQHR